MTVLITGANGSLGMGLALNCLERHIPVILGCRSIQKYHDVAHELRQKVPHAQLEPFIADLGVPESVLAGTHSLLLLKPPKITLFCVAGRMSVGGFEPLKGLYDLVFRPSYLAKTGGDALVQVTGAIDHGYGQCFGSNVFGHYILIRELQSILERVVWFTSTTAIPDFFDHNDLQCLVGSHPYESSKRLCEILKSAMIPSLAQNHISSFVVSPGNMASHITNAVVPPWLLLMRFLCLSGINITGYNGATSAMAVLDRVCLDDDNVVHHSEINVFGKTWTVEYPIESPSEALSNSVLLQMDQLYSKVKSLYSNKEKSKEQ